MKERFLILFFCLCGLTLSDAALTWESTLYQHTATVDEDHAVATFPFQNTGNTPVQILEVRPSCGCTVAQLEKRIYQPGESGEIELKFTYGARTGLQNVNVSVLTSNRTIPINLSLEVMIPVLVELTPRILYWRQGESMEPRTVRVTLHAESGLELVEVKSGNSAFSHKLIPGDNPGEYALEITPPEDGRRQMDRIDLVTKAPDREETVYPVWVGIR